MPIYEYRCECGALLESIERVGTQRALCDELCVRAAATGTDGGITIAPGCGRVERVLSTGMIRGDGREAKEPTFDPCKRSNRPGGGCDDF